MIVYTIRQDWAGGTCHKWEVKTKGFSVSLHYSDGKGSKGRKGLGRFGGGWNWKLGFEVGGRTLILNCLIFYIRINLLHKRKM